MPTPHVRRSLGVAALCVAVLAAACSSGSSSSHGGPGTTGSGTSTTHAPLKLNGTSKAGDVLLGKVTRVAATRSETTRGGAAIRAFAADGYSSLSQLPDSAGKNLVMSPYSIKVALAMLLNGAKGDTATQIRGLLQVPPDGDMNASLNSVDQVLATRNGPVSDPDTGAKGTIALRSANSLWVQAGLAVNPPFLDNLSRYYGAGPRVVDFVHATEDARGRINTWVAEQTAQRIKELLTKGSLDSDTRLVLVNALYAKAPWRTPFEKGATAPAPFTTASGKSVTASFMNATLQIPYVQGNGFRAITLPYLGNQLGLSLLLPDQGRFTDIETSLNKGDLALAMGDTKPVYVKLALPKFNLSTHTSLRTLLETMGMKLAFDPNQADLSGMAGKPHDLWVGDVIHAANITVDEAGTEASAATAVTVETQSARVPPTPAQTITLDRPFIFVLQDRTTGTPLFIGRVVDPTQS